MADRNGGDSTNTIFFISSSTLAKATHKQKVIADEAFRIVPPVEKTLACGELGTGGLAEESAILAAIAEARGPGRRPE